MSENNVSLIQEAYAAFGRGDVAAILDRFTDSFEFVVRAEGALWSAAL